MAGAAAGKNHIFLQYESERNAGGHETLPAEDGICIPMLPGTVRGLPALAASSAAGFHLFLYAAGIPGGIRTAEKAVP